MATVISQCRHLVSHPNSVVGLNFPSQKSSYLRSAGMFSMGHFQSVSMTQAKANGRESRIAVRVWATKTDFEGRGVEDDIADSKQTFDVSSNCVTPVFRSAKPPNLQADEEEAEDGKVRILFLSEGNVCRSVYAEAIFFDLLHQHNLQEFVKCSSMAVRDYNEGESPDPRLFLVAEERGFKLPEGKVSVVFDCARDIVNADLVLVFDKFNASDVLKEVTIYEAVDKTSRHAGKVRRLGEFCLNRNIEDIEDPLYGNMGGPDELELLHEVVGQIRDSCEGLVETILNIKASLQGSETLKEGMKRSLGEMEALNWLVPPMLSRA
ncbi:hypothetical protein R1sor_015176 [Riccia sorocarpa]|uniref:Phosphotyrosine protein phosphatase I domain-containing protein n=1 Tax=Riccia sorocarpa TaxID=122646 RepID=A0ABD3HE94_9MARC